MNQSQPTFFADVQLAADRQRRICNRSFTPLRSVQDDKGAFSHYSLPRLLGATRRHSRLHPSSRLTVMAGSTPTIIPEKQSFSPGLLHKNATIRGNPALIRPFSPKTPGLLHRPPCPPHSSPCPARLAISTPTIIPEEQPFPPGLLHKNATISGNPALILPFPPKTPGLLHRPSRSPHTSPCPARPSP